MGQKINPKNFRLGITTTWRSRWFSDKKNYVQKLKEDIKLRELIIDKWKTAGIADVEIERSTNSVKIIIYTSRPGVLIGRGGSGLEDLNRIVKNKFFAGQRLEIKVEVKEVRKFEENASLVAQNIVEQIEKRIPFRRVMKSMLDQVEKNKKVRGVKIELSGRLGGAEMSRVEWLSRGRIPLHTLRADVDYAKAVARTTYGAIGVKVWIYKGDVFKKDNSEKNIKEKR